MTFLSAPICISGLTAFQKAESEDPSMGIEPGSNGRGTPNQGTKLRGRLTAARSALPAAMSVPTAPLSAVSRT